MSPVLMSMVTTWFASSRTHRRSPDFATITGRRPPGSANRTTSLFTAGASCNTLFGVVFAAAIVGAALGDSDGEADGDTEGEADANVEADDDADADNALLAFAAIGALNADAEGAGADAISVGPFDFTTLS